jgi:hypothetical protein
VSRLAAAFRRAELDAEAARNVREILEAGEEPPANPRALPGDKQRLRGIPAVGYGVSGACGGAAQQGSPSTFLTEAEVDAWTASLGDPGQFDEFGAACHGLEAEGASPKAAGSACSTDGRRFGRPRSAFPRGRRSFSVWLLG